MLNNNGKAGLLVYTSGGYWYGNVKIEEGAKFTASGNANGIEIQKVFWICRRAR